MGGGAAAHNGACARNWSTVSGIQPCRGLPHNTGGWTSAPTSRKRARASADNGWVPNLGLAPRRVLSWLDMADERGDRSRAEIDIRETNHPSGRSARTRVARARSGSGTCCSRALVWAVERGLFQPVDGEIVLPNREVVSTVPIQKARMKVGGYHLAVRTDLIGQPACDTTGAAADFEAARPWRYAPLQQGASGGRVERAPKDPRAAGVLVASVDRRHSPSCQIPVCNGHSISNRNTSAGGTQSTMACGRRSASLDSRGRWSEGQGRHW